MTYLILFAAGLVIAVAAPALMFGRMVELIVKRTTERSPPIDRP